MTVEQTLIVVMAAIQTPMVVAMFSLLRRQGGITAQFAAIDTRFDAVDNRLDGIDARLDKIDTRLDRMDARLDRMEDHFNSRFDRMEGLLTQLVEGIHGMDKRIAVLEAQTMPQTASRSQTASRPQHPAQERPA